MMSLDATVQFRTNALVKDAAFSVFQEMGISPSAAMQLFLQQVQKTKTLPFIISANDQTENKDEGYDHWLRVRLADTVKKLDNGAMKSSSIDAVEMRLKTRRIAKKSKPTHA